MVIQFPGSQLLCLFLLYLPMRRPVIFEDIFCRREYGRQKVTVEPSEQWCSYVTVHSTAFTVWVTSLDMFFEFNRGLVPECNQSAFNWKFTGSEVEAGKDEPVIGRYYYSWTHSKTAWFFTFVSAVYKEFEESAVYGYSSSAGDFAKQPCVARW